MGAPFVCVNVVDVGVDVFRVLSRILEGDFVANTIGFPFQIDRHQPMQRVARPVEIFDELDNAPFIVELLTLVVAVIVEDDLYAFVQKGQLLQTF